MSRRTAARIAVCSLAAALALGFVLGLALGLTVRAAQTSSAAATAIPAAVSLADERDPSRLRPVSDAGARSPLPAAVAVLPARPQPTATAAPVPAHLVRGIASWMPARYGPLYLALPEGAGVRVRICGAAGCLVMRSTDAGPSLAEQRAGRIADIAVVVWERLTGLPSSRGVAWVTVERLP